MFSATRLAGVGVVCALILLLSVAAATATTTDRKDHASSVDTCTSGAWAGAPKTVRHIRFTEDYSSNYILVWPNAPTPIPTCPGTDTVWTLEIHDAANGKQLGTTASGGNVGVTNASAIAIVFPNLPYPQNSTVIFGFVLFNAGINPNPYGCDKHPVCVAVRNAQPGDTGGPETVDVYPVLIWHPFGKPAPAAPPPPSTGQGTPAQPAAEVKTEDQKKHYRKADNTLEALGTFAGGVGALISAVGGVLAITGAGEVSTIVAAPVGVPSLIAGGVLMLVGATTVALGKYMANVAEDPPDPNFHSVASPARLVVAHVPVPATSRPPVRRAVASANALADNGSRLIAVLQALMTSHNRSSSALAAGDAAAELRQQNAEIAYARQAATLLAKDVRLRHRLATMLLAAHMDVTVKPGKLPQVSRFVRKAGLPKPFSDILVALGLGPDAIGAIARRAAAGLAPPGGRLAVSAVLVDPETDAAELAAAASLRDFAAGIQAKH